MEAAAQQGLPQVGRTAIVLVNAPDRLTVIMDCVIQLVGIRWRGKAGWLILSGPPIQKKIDNAQIL